MKVYRLERNGWGVFCPGAFMRMPYSDDALYSHFGYSCDPAYQCEEEWRAACESVEKLKEYFGSDFKWALDHGASLVEYTVLKRYVRFGKLEVTFYVSQAKARRVVIKGEDSNILQGPPVNNFPSFEIKISKDGMKAWATRPISMGSLS
jgi:hypothetical protein